MIAGQEIQLQGVFSFIKNFQINRHYYISTNNNYLLLYKKNIIKNKNKYIYKYKYKYEKSRLKFIY